MPERAEISSWLHIGGLHMTGAGLENHRSLLRIVDLLQALDPCSIDFAVLPGDSADDGTAAQFALVRDIRGTVRGLCGRCWRGGTSSRSTGQIEEGPVGFSLAAVDGGVVSKRFRPRNDPWPFVMITSPADHRLIIDPHSPDQVIRGTLRIAGKVWGMSAATRVHASIDGGPAFTLACDARSAALWGGVADESLTDGKHDLGVRAESEATEAASDTVSFLVSRDGSFERLPTFGGRSDRDAVGVWPGRHLLGTPLGPDRIGRHW